MKEGQFIDLIGIHYNKIKSLFTSRLYKNNLEFNEDIFNDTLIKCNKKFNNDIITYDTLIKYFWVAYLNTLKIEISNNKSYNDNIDYFDEEIHDCIDDIENTRAKFIYNKVMKLITDKFCENDMYIYSLYMYHNWSIEELLNNGYNCEDFENKIKKIHKFVKTTCKKQLSKGS